MNKHEKEIEHGKPYDTFTGEEIKTYELSEGEFQILKEEQEKTYLLISTIKPILTNMHKQFSEIGLTHDDLVTLIHRRLRNAKISRTKIEQVIKTIRKFEKQIFG
jgi:Glu-tRNA(Gln) amidotransferase subunit E-like FAD-binding protein